MKIGQLYKKCCRIHNTLSTVSIHFHPAFYICTHPVPYTHLVCRDCCCFYIGQTGRAFKKRFKEHLPKKDPSRITSNYARHLVDNNHNYTDFASNFQPLHMCKKGRYMSAVEEFEIYKAFKETNTQKVLLNEQLQFQSNSLYDTAIQIQTKRCV